MPGFQFQNYSLEVILLACSFLLIVSVLSSRITSRFGVPSLLLFLGIGMLAGSEGPGGIDFEDYSLSFAIGSICLALILFDGGMRTSWKTVRPILGLGISLSFVGTVVTGIATGVFARFTLNLSWIEGMLLGAIVSSTDAAAVFSILRARSLTLKGSLKPILEFEAGSNDPVAIFMTVGVLTLAVNQSSGSLTLVNLFLMQAGFGLVIGYFGGRGIHWLINHVGIEYEGLYSVLLLSSILCLFAVTAVLGGSGFLAVYVAGVVLGNLEFLHKGSMSRFLDGLAWMSQILVFLTLGLLVTPSHLMSVWREGFILSVFMMFFARPLSVLIAAPGGLLGQRERVFVGWVGLRGAAPVILATLPWSVDFPKAEFFFNLVFFVVLTSVIAQGISISWMAKLVGVTVPLEDEAPQSLAPGFLPVGFVSVEIDVQKNSGVVNQRLVDIGLPAGVMLTSLEREKRYLVPKGDTVLEEGDRILGLARPSNLEALRVLFGAARIIR